MTPKVKAAVLLSGSGRTLQNFLDCIAGDRLDLEIAAVASSRPGVKGLEIAERAGIPARVFRRKDFADAGAHNQAINDWLQPFTPRMIILAGYLCFYISPEGFTGPVVNIHPALLPRYGGKGYYGDRVHAAVLAAGDKMSGCTVHLVNEHYDEGAILQQQQVPVLPEDDVHSLAARVFTAECELYPRVLNDLAAGLADLEE